MPEKKIQSVNELARYHIGDTVWWLALRECEPPPQIPQSDEWMVNYHPKVVYTMGPFRKLWPKHRKLPKLHYEDFNVIVWLLRTTLEIESFVVDEILRSKDTGEFYYYNNSVDWMPESMLCDTQTAAERERTRILNMIKKWAQVK